MTVFVFEMGRHKNVKMLFYAKKKTNGSIHFKVMIPQIDNGASLVGSRTMPDFI